MEPRFQNYFLIIQDDGEYRVDFYGEALKAMNDGRKVVEVKETTLLAERTVVKTTVLTYLN